MSDLTIRGDFAELHALATGWESVGDGFVATFAEEGAVEALDLTRAMPC